MEERIVLMRAYDSGVFSVKELTDQFGISRASRLTLCMVVCKLRRCPLVSDLRSTLDVSSCICFESVVGPLRRYVAAQRNFWFWGDRVTVLASYQRRSVLGVERECVELSRSSLVTHCVGLAEANFRASRCVQFTPRRNGRLSADLI